MIICWKFTHSLAIQDVEEFVSLSPPKMFLKDWSLVDYYGVLSAAYTLILTAPIHCRGSIGEQVISVQRMFIFE